MQLGDQSWREYASVEFPLFNFSSFCMGVSSNTRTFKPAKLLPISFNTSQYFWLFHTGCNLTTYLT